VPGEAVSPPDPGQLALFSAEAVPDPVMTDLRAIDLDALTPLEALNRLAELQKRAGGRA
jgi:DNA mismatch repair protein MutS